MKSAEGSCGFYRTMINHFFGYFLSRKPGPFRRFDFSGRNMFFEFNILKCNFVCQANVKGNRSCIQSRLNFDSSLRINLADELHFFTLANTDVKFISIFAFFVLVCVVQEGGILKSTYVRFRQITLFTCTLDLKLRYLLGCYFSLRCLMTGDAQRTEG